MRPLRPSLPPPLVATAAAGALVLIGCGTTEESSEANESPAEPVAEMTAGDDFDGDGFDDLVITVPKATIDGRPLAGCLAVVPGSAEGPVPDSPRVISRTSEGVPGEPVDHDQFGDQSVTGDFDGDGFDDLLVTAHGGDVTDEVEQGPVLLWGSEAGLGAGTPLDPETSSEPLVGDFNGDGDLDMAEFPDGAESAQAPLRFRYGPFSRDGAPADTDSAEIDVEIGSVSVDLLAGDLNGDGVSDLVAFRSFEEMAHDTLAWLGSKSGPPEPLDLDDPLPKADEGTIVDVDADGYGDLVMRVLTQGTVEDPPNVPSEIEVVHGSAKGPNDRRTTLTLDSEGVPGEESDGDQLGFALDSGDFDGDGYGDVVAGVTRPEPDTGSIVDNGHAIVLMGAPDGLSGEGADRFGPEDADVEPPQRSTSDERISNWPRSRLHTLDIDGDGRTEVVVGGPVMEGVAGTSDEARPGPVWAFHDTGNGLEGVLSVATDDLGVPSEPGTGSGQDFAR